MHQVEKFLSCGASFSGPRGIWGPAATEAFSGLSRGSGFVTFLECPSKGQETHHSVEIVIFYNSLPVELISS